MKIEYGATSWLANHSLRSALQTLLISIVILFGLQTAQAATIVVSSGGNLQGAIDSAQPGDTIILEAGGTFMGPINLPNKGGASYITIQSSALPSLPASGVRISPAYASMMPKIVSPPNSTALLTADSAHHFRFVGVEFTSTTGYVYNLLNLGRDDFSSLSQVPHHLEFDRCYIHSPGLNRIRRGFAMNSAETTIINSYVSGFAGVQDETQAIACWNGPGPFHIVNNYLEAGAEVILIGGSDPSIQGLVPADVEIRRNILTRQLSWRGQVTIKNVLELKNAKRVQVIGNIIEHGLDCTAITFTVRNQTGGAPWSTIEDVDMMYNVIRQSGGAVNILGADDLYPSQKMKRVRISNNLFEDISHINWGGSGYFLQIADGQDISIEHNTIFHSGNMITAHRAPVANFLFRDNIVAHNSYGVWGENAGVNMPAIQMYFGTTGFTRNVIVDTQSIGGLGSQFPTGNFITQNYGTVGFVNLQSGNYRLASGSPYKGQGTGGTDIGCDFTALEAAMAGNPVPTPTPTPTATPTPTPTPGPTPTPTPTPPPASGTLVDDFNDNTFDASKWVYNTIQGAIYTGPYAWDATVPVLERNQRLEISPRSNVSGDHYNGYVFANAWNMTNMRATVEVVQTTSNSADTNLAVCFDSHNFYMISVEAGQLRFEQVVNGARSSTSVAFSGSQHRFWRIRHVPSGDSIVFETSSDGQTFTVRRTVARQLSITSLRAEISAGTWEALGVPGTAIFDNFRLESNNQLQPLASPTLVANAYQTAMALAALQNPDSTQLLGLATSIEQAYTAFIGEYSRFSSATDVDKLLRNALASANMARVVPRTLVRKRLQITAQYLSDALALMQATGSRMAEVVSQPTVAPVSSEGLTASTFTIPPRVKRSHARRMRNSHKR